MAIAGAGILYFDRERQSGIFVAAALPRTATELTRPDIFDGRGICCRGRYDVLLPDRHSRLDPQVAPKGFAPIAIGLCLTLIHLISIPVTNTSVNPARSHRSRLFSSAGAWAISQLWLFWVAPILGALLAGFLYTWFVGDDELLLQRRRMLSTRSVIEKRLDKSRSVNLTGCQFKISAERCKSG